MSDSWEEATGQIYSNSLGRKYFKIVEILKLNTSQLLRDCD